MQIENMLYAHQDLLEEFTRFLPNISRPILIPIVPALQDHLLGQMLREMQVVSLHYGTVGY